MNNTTKIWTRFRMSRRQFLRTFGIASGAITFSPMFAERFLSAMAQLNTEKVYLVKNGDCFQNTARIWELLGGSSSYISDNDVVVIKGNCQIDRQGYTHTGCIKGVIDEILKRQAFSGQIYICDNTQLGGGLFNASASQRGNNWPDHSWNSLAAEYQTNGRPVATKQWFNSTGDIGGPSDGEGWIRDWFTLDNVDTYLSYPVFESPLIPGQMIDLGRGVWEEGSYQDRSVKTIVMPTLNNHGIGGEDYAGVTSAIKSFFGATEIHDGASGSFRGHAAIHRSSYRSTNNYCGHLVARYINTLHRPTLYITAAMWSGYYSRNGPAVETKTVLACENPATLDYVATKYVISPHAPWLDPDLDNNTRATILGCISQGVGTIDPAQFEIISYDFDNPSVNRLDIERKIRDFKAGAATETEVKDFINQYMESP